MRQASAGDKNVGGGFDPYEVMKGEDNTNIFEGAAKVGLSSEDGMSEVDGMVHAKGEVRDICSLILLAPEDSAADISYMLHLHAFYRFPEQKTINTSTKPFTLDDSMKELNELSRGIRGSGSNDADSASILPKVKGIATSLLESMKLIQGHFRDSNKEEAAEAIKAIVGNSNSLIETSNDSKLANDIHFSRSFGDITSSDAHPLTLSDIPNYQLANFVQPQIVDQFIEHTEDLVQLLEDVPLLTSTRQPNHSERYFSQQSQSTQGKDFKFESAPFDYSTGGQSHFHQVNQQSHPNSYINLKNKLYQHQSKMGNGSFKRSSALTSLFEKDKFIMAKHQLRQEALGDAVCAQACNANPDDPDSYKCFCQNLFDCVNDMTEYDLAVLIADGYIDKEPSSDHFGNFTVSSTSLNLFDSDEDVKSKLARIQGNAVVTDPTILQCRQVLEQLYTACDPSKVTCSNPNVELFQVSTERVCAAVNTPTKLLFETIGDQFDGFVEPSEWKQHAESL